MTSKSAVYTAGGFKTPLNTAMESDCKSRSYCTVAVELSGNWHKNLNIAAGVKCVSRVVNQIFIL
jgi:hypothetical protein